MSRPILLDTDLGSDVDDAIALATLLGCGDALDLRACTTVAGNTAGRAQATARLLGIGGRTDVPVSVGAQDALVRPNAFVWRDIETKGYPDAPDAPITDEPAYETILRLSHEVPGIDLVAIGPMTNVAHAVAQDPTLPERIGRLVVMGGHIRSVRVGDLEAKHGIDYNLCSDPEATMTVLGAGFRTRLVTADVTLQTWLTEPDLVAFEAGGPVARALVPLIRIWTPYQRKIFVDGLGGTLAPDNVAFLHDPLTILSLVDPAPIGFETLRIVPTIERGVLRTIEVPAASGLGTEMEVATSVDAPAARAAIAERIARV